MRFVLFPLALLLPVAAPASAAPDAFICTGENGAASFSLQMSQRGDWDADYAVMPAPGNNPEMTGAGTLSRLDGGTSYEIVDGPLKDFLKARFLRPDSDRVLFIDGPQSGRYRCEKPT